MQLEIDHLLNATDYILDETWLEESNAYEYAQEWTISWQYQFKPRLKRMNVVFWDKLFWVAFQTLTSINLEWIDIFMMF